MKRLLCGIVLAAILLALSAGCASTPTPRPGAIEMDPNPVFVGDDEAHIAPIDEYFRMIRSDHIAHVEVVEIVTDGAAYRDSSTLSVRVIEDYTGRWSAGEIKYLLVSGSSKWVVDDLPISAFEEGRQMIVFACFGDIQYLSEGFQAALAEAGVEELYAPFINPIFISEIDEEPYVAKRTVPMERRANSIEIDMDEMMTKSYGDDIDTRQRQRIETFFKQDVVQYQKMDNATVASLDAFVRLIKNEILPNYEKIQEERKASGK